MAKSFKIGADLAAGFVFPFIFFAMNDPDRVSFPAMALWHVLLLVPAAAVLSMRSRGKPFLAGAKILAGIFIGTCVAIIALHPEQANMFPIAAAIWTIVALFPIAVGSALGSIAMRILSRRH